MSCLLPKTEHKSYLEEINAEYFSFRNHGAIIVLKKLLSSHNLTVIHCWTLNRENFQGGEEEENKENGGGKEKREKILQNKSLKTKRNSHYK